jgi:CheY-like chemotaxis protein
LDDAILNLLLNAMDAMPAGGTITITTQTVDAGVQLTVSDTGIGMDAQTRRRVFEPFFTTKANVGSGLGLSSVHGTLTRWGGTVEVDSTPGQGTTFTLCFPVWRESATPVGTPTTAVTPVRSGNLLIVEDDEEVCDLLDRLLSASHTVTVVRDGREALAQFVPGQRDVALIDLGMPGLAGDRVAAEMVAADSCLATILITGWPLASTDRRGSGFDFRLAKPFDDLDDVEATVKQAIALHDARG